MAKKVGNPQASKLREAREIFDLKLSTGSAALRLPARMTWEDRHRLKALIDLIPDPLNAQIIYPETTESIGEGGANE